MERNPKFQTVIQACNLLLNQVQCDFVGLAFQNSDGPDITWRFAAGNRNDKYKRIAVRYGKGIAGRVILTGRPIEVTDFPNHIQGKSLEYPIMLAEKLVSAYAVPVLYKFIPKGVLLVGCRRQHIFTETEQQHVQRLAIDIQEMLNNLIKF